MGIEGVEHRAHPLATDILTDEAAAFVAAIHRRFEPRRRELLDRRVRRQTELDAGARPGFAPETESVRRADWQVAAPPKDLEDRRVEIVGPVDHRSVVSSLESGARVLIADFEDTTSPTWNNIIEGQANLRSAVRGAIVDDRGDLHEQVATMVRVRGWHLEERHFRIDGAPVAAGLFDFALSAFHNGREALDRGSGPYFYLPKLEDRLEARLWNEVFEFAERRLGFDPGTIRATVLIETITAAFEMDEILYELRERSVGLSAGRWDYIFSLARAFCEHADFVLPDRADLGMRVPFMRAYNELLVATCHRRGAHAIGGMAAFIPDLSDPALTEASLAKVRSDKRHEAGDGYDGSWVAHPDLVAAARAEFDRVLGDQPNQVDRQRDDVYVTPGDLLAVRSTPGSITDDGVRTDVIIAIRYLSCWLTGTGLAAIDNRMEDLATVELSRSQLWQWIRHGARLEDGRVITPDLVRRILADETGRLRADIGEVGWRSGRYDEACRLFEQVSLAPDFCTFLTHPAYQIL